MKDNHKKTGVPVGQSKRKAKTKQIKEQDVYEVTLINNEVPYSYTPINDIIMYLLEGETTEIIINLISYQMSLGDAIALKNVLNDLDIKVTFRCNGLLRGSVTLLVFGCKKAKLIIAPDTLFLLSLSRTVFGTVGLTADETDEVQNVYLSELYDNCYAHLKNIKTSKEKMLNGEWTLYIHQE